MQSGTTPLLFLPLAGAQPFARPRVAVASDAASRKGSVAEKGQLYIDHRGQIPNLIWNLRPLSGFQFDNPELLPRMAALLVGLFCSRRKIMKRLACVLCHLLFSVLILTSFFACLPAFAQDTNNQAVGFPANGSFSGGGIDTVQLNNGNLHVELPLFALPGRGPGVAVKYVYDSKGWYAHTLNIVQDSPVYIDPRTFRNFGANNLPWAISAPLANGSGLSGVVGGGGPVLVIPFLKQRTPIGNRTGLHILFRRCTQLRTLAISQIPATWFRLPTTRAGPCRLTGGDCPPRYSPRRERIFRFREPFPARLDGPCKILTVTRLPGQNQGLLRLPISPTRSVVALTWLQSDPMDLANTTLLTPTPMARLRPFRSQ